MAKKFKYTETDGERRLFFLEERYRNSKGFLFGIDAEDEVSKSPDLEKHISLIEHQIYAERIRENPEPYIANARKHIANSRREALEAGFRIDNYALWEELLDGPLDELLTFMVSRCYLAMEQRTVTPFRNILTRKETEKLYKEFLKEWNLTHREIWRPFIV